MMQRPGPPPGPPGKPGAIPYRHLQSGPAANAPGAPRPPSPFNGNAIVVVLAVLGVVGVFLYRKGLIFSGDSASADGLTPSGFMAPKADSPSNEELCRLGPCKRTFYMYRAQSDVDYPMENINGGNLPGVMWYLHNEVVVSVPRKYDVTRVLRLKVTMTTTQAWWNSHFSQFAPFMAFDGARCTVPNSDSFWDTYGFVIGCQASQMDVAAYTSYTPSIKYCQPGRCNAPVWYSLPGKCPSQDFMGKDEACQRRYPGGAVYSSYNDTTGLGDRHDWNVTGAWNSTYHVEWAGEVRLDELVGIDNYTIFRYSGMREYDAWSDQGEGVSFWNGIHNETACHERMERMRWLIHQSAQHLDPAEFPFDYPEPVCDSP
jgi:hypothetical protein